MESTPSLQQALDEQLAYWQKVLGLQDWTIRVQVARHWEMDEPDTLATIRHTPTRRSAVITVLHPHDVPALSDRFVNDEEKDYDLTLVHELLHLHFAAFTDVVDANPALSLAEEQAINAISRGLIRLYRDQQPVPLAALRQPAGKSEPCEFPSTTPSLPTAGHPVTPGPMGAYI